ncbi:NADP-dependent oxidoreductase [Nocardia sp. NPDC024068]|uniref:NADP-dependent oxidoreductase n=1 Tax=Nocardia sp. NPDC024068 TaxID=3157197 RepID=UPI0033F92B04
MSTTFRAAVVRIPGGPDSVDFLEAPVTAPGPGQVRVAVAAAAVNPVDLALADGVFHRLGLIGRDGPVGLGSDFAGVVAEAGSGVGLAVGTRVAGMVGGFDRDLGTYAQQLIVAAGDIAVVPAGFDLTTAATVPLNGLTAAQLADLLGDGDGRTLLVTGAAGAVGGYLIPLARARGWRVTGLARAEDEDFVRGLGADFTTAATPGYDAVADPAVLQEEALALVRDGGRFLGVRPGQEPRPERDITTGAVSVRPDGARLGELLEAAADGRLPARVHAVVPLAQAATAHREVAKGGVRGKFVLTP